MTTIDIKRVNDNFNWVVINNGKECASGSEINFTVAAIRAEAAKGELENGI